MEKSETDDKYIKALRGELSKAKEELERLRNAPAETVTRVVYKQPEELGDYQQNSLLNFSHGDVDELTKVLLGQQVRREAAIKDYELGKKDRIIGELMEQKLQLEDQLAATATAEPSQTDRDLQRLRSQFESLKLEKEELLRFTAGGTKGESYHLIKDLSNENARLRLQLSMQGAGAQKKIN